MKILSFSPTWIYKSDMSTWQIIATFLSGIAALGFGIIMFRALYISPDWVRVEGNVVGYEQRTSSGNEVAIVEYTVDGNAYRAANDHVEKKRSDTTKPVAYDPNNPDNGKVVLEGNFIKLGYAMPFLGTYFILMSIYAFFKR